MHQDSLPDDQFRILKVIEEKKCGRGFKYLVEWEGYDSGHNSWVKSSDINKALVEEFKNKSTESSSSSSSSHLAASTSSVSTSSMIINPKTERGEEEIEYELGLVGLLPPSAPSQSQIKVNNSIEQLDEVLNKLKSQNWLALDVALCEIADQLK